eukprot:3395486-Prymnesium_polylepis.1
MPPTGVALLRTPPAARDRGGAGPARTCGRPDRSSRLPSMQWGAHCAAHPLASSPTHLPPSAAGTCRPLKPLPLPPHGPLLLPSPRTGAPCRLSCPRAHAAPPLPALDDARLFHVGTGPLEA